MNSQRQCKSNSSRSNRGSTAIELGAAALIMISLVAFGLNICIAMIGYTMNDRACRDAARSAAQAATTTEATTRASRILASYRGSSPLFKQLRLSQVTYTDFGGTPPDGVAPFVTVTTVAESDVPCAVNVFGKNVFGDKMQFRRSYTFPIVKLTVPLGS